MTDNKTVADIIPCIKDEHTSDVQKMHDALDVGHWVRIAKRVSIRRLANSTNIQLQDEWIRLDIAETRLLSILLSHGIRHDD